jgi:hypothetical protein
MSGVLLPAIYMTYFHNVRLAHGPARPPVQWIPRPTSLGTEWQGLFSDNPTLPGPKIRNYGYIPPCTYKFTIGCFINPYIAKKNYRCLYNMYLKYQKCKRIPCTVFEIYHCSSQSFIRLQSEGKHVVVVSACRLVLFRHARQCLWVGLLALYGGINIKFSFSLSFIPSGY